MRLFLDAHVSGRRVAAVLRELGHDVRAADEERELDGTTDEDLLSLAAREHRIMVTFNVRDFARIAQEWGESGQSHAGLLMVVGIDHGEFGAIIRTVQKALQTRIKAADWKDYACFGARPTVPPGRRSRRRARR